MTDLRLSHTADLAPEVLLAAHALLDEAFDGGFSDADWEHSLGGLHALVWDGGQLIGHGALVQRRILHAGQALRTGYVEGVGVRAERRRQGHAATLMGALERAVRTAYQLGALAASEEATGFYAGRGWLCWPGPTSVLTPDGIRRTPEEDGGIYVLPGSVELVPTAELTCDWRDGDVW